MKKYFSRAHLKHDLPASLVVFLVALPLCLGIALASGAPLISGIISGMIGGLVVGLLSGSQTSVSGPAAGLSAIVLSAITQLGAFETFLLAVVLAGAMQLVFGLLRGGIVANYFPSAVIKGLLAAIGVILILKQIPHALGYDRDSEGDFSFLQIDEHNTFTEVIYAFLHPHAGAVVITLVSLAVLILWQKTKLKNSMVPAPMIVVVLGVLLHLFFSRSVPTLALEANHVVNLPSFDGIAGFLHSMTHPDWSQIRNPAVYSVALTLAIVASLETLLNLEAVDKIDPKKRYSPPNRELLAQGAGNILSGLVGGIPLTSVIVRSSANIHAQAQTKVSAILHGVLLFGCVLAIPQVLNLIPLSCLAAILLVTGYKLASIKVMKEMWSKGFSQFIPFAVTLLAIVFTDLLIGICIGLSVGVFYILLQHMKMPFRYITEKHHSGEVTRIRLAQDVSFLNRASMLTTLERIPEGSDVILDAQGSEYIDYDVLEIIREFREVKAPERGIRVSAVGFRERYNMHDEVHHVNVLDAQTQANLTPADVLQVLKEGNDRFVRGERIERDLLMQVGHTSETQYPMAAVLGCIDSRTTSELIFDLGLGDIFNVRMAGNVANPDVVGSLEFATHVSGARLIVVLGHTNCGAIKAACDHVELGHISGLLEKIHPAMNRERETTANRNSTNTAFVDRVTRLNVTETIEWICRESALLTDLIGAKKLAVVGAVYDLRTGRVEFLDSPNP